MNAADSRARTPGQAGFSLIEVAIATGLCAGALGAVLAMIAPLLTVMRELEERSAALRIASSLDARWSVAPWSEVVASVEAGDVWFADASGARLGTATDPVWASAGVSPAEVDGAKRFEFAAVRDAQLSDSATLVYAWVVRWPAYSGDGRRVTDPAAQSLLVLLSARNR